MYILTLPQIILQIFLCNNWVKNIAFKLSHTLLRPKHVTLLIMAT